MAKRGRIHLFQISGSDHEINISGPFFQTSLPGGLSEWEPPDPIPNSEVKLLSADDSVGLPHVKVGHCQAFNPKPRYRIDAGFFLSP